LRAAFACAPDPMRSFDVHFSIDHLQVASVTRESEFAALKDAWNELAGQSATRSIFLSHDWFEAAWAWRRLDSTLELNVASKAHRPIAILPLIRNRAEGKGPRRLELLTVPDTQLSDLIASPEAATE